MADNDALPTDDLIAGRRSDDAGGLPADMPRWMALAIRGIDTLSRWIGLAVCWLTLPLMLAMLYEVIARYAFTAPTVWAYDISRMLYGALFVLGAGYALYRGVHIRSDFLYRNWSVRTQARVDALLYIVFYFPSVAIFFWVAANWAWVAVSRGERGMDTAWMPMLGPIKSCLPIGLAFLLLQGISELLKCLYAMQKGRWPNA